jgi:GT2 family glycosyltransferase
MNGVSFVIVNYFSSGYLVPLVRSIAQWITGSRYEVLICDNSADPSEAAILRGIAGGPVRLFFPEENLGFVRANNALVAQAQHDVVVLLNPDTLLVDASLEALFDLVSRDQDIGACGPRLLNPDRTEQIGHFRFPTIRGVVQEHLLLTRRNPYAYAERHEVTTVCDVVKGTCLVLQRQVAEQAGPFDERLVMYSEEVDLCRRLNLRGLHNVYFPSARIVHYGEKSARQERSNAYSLWHYHRSRVLYFRKHHSRRSAWVVNGILFLSLIEKMLGLTLIGKRSSAAAHAETFRRLVHENPLFGRNGEDHTRVIVRWDKG